MTEPRKRHPVRIIASFLIPVIAVLALAGIVAIRINTNTELAQQAHSQAIINEKIASEARRVAATACGAARQQVDGVFTFLHDRIVANGGPTAPTSLELIAALEDNAKTIAAECLTGRPQPSP